MKTKENRKLQELCNVCRGASPRPISDPKYFGGNVGWVRIIDVTRSNKYLRKTEDYVSKLGEKNSVKVEKGQLIMSICGTVGKPVIADIPACIHDGFVKFYDLNGVDKNYLYYSLQFSEEKLKSYGQQGTQVNLNTTLVGNLKIFTPKLIEQQKIAEILTTVDNIIEKTEQFIEKYKKVKEGMMQNLFTRGIDENGNLRPSYEEAPHLYKETELGMIPKNWKLTSLNEHGEIITGNTPSTDNPEYYKGDYLFISPYDINENTIFVNSTDKTLTTLGLKQTRVVPEKSICVTCIGSTIGKIAITSEPCATNQQINTLIPHDTTIYKLLYYLIQYYLKKQLNVEAGLQAVPIVNKDKFSRLKIPMPQNNLEQSLSIKVLDLEDKTIQNEIKYLNKLKKLKQGLMQDLLTGKVRVKV
ncbi:restriction endonuclease subunit S [Natranaerofaba carboxydovora]|uniref:restriction endonuclease subunit S n=1 Tax=Natranaerofaba carboxydovora TaxID=2742683 RepID=UPI001F135CD2|nr:restriction endonuclease subunit S [Natranaerofaba carboxydovora]UMZ73734.1 Type I restriction modification DNA specificity domain protein [Natranaerofaba carboxydovora]